MTSLRKRHAPPLLQLLPNDKSARSSSDSSLPTAADPSSEGRRRDRTNRWRWPLACVHAAIFLSSPLFLLFVVHTHLSPLEKRSLLHTVVSATATDAASQHGVDSTLVPERNQSRRHPVEKNNNSTSTGGTTTPDATNTTNRHRHNEAIVPVVVWPYIEYGAGTAELQHFCENGIDESPALELSHDMEDVRTNIVWIGDFGFTFPPSRWCDAFLEKIQEAKRARRAISIGQGKSWPVLIVDWSDRTNVPKCPQIEEEMGSENVHYFIRNVVDHRKWNSSIDWVNVGQRTRLGPNYHHVPLFVRTDTVEMLYKVLQEDHGMSLSSPIEAEIDRPVDVSHFWPLNLKGVKDTNHGKLRQKVSQTITQLSTPQTASSKNDTTIKSSAPTANHNSHHYLNRDVSVFVGLAGNALQAGRRQVQAAYIRAMLCTKIIVVTQRDEWEDHYRLNEALVSGAMVMTDRMLSLPNGLVNGTSIVEFTSSDDLRQKILHYLKNDDERTEIARRGREVSMSQHRTFHRVEQVVFGRILSDCSRAAAGASASSNCPWIVHVSEAAFELL